MARYHTTPNGNIPFTPEEEIARDLEEAEFEVVLLERAKTQYQRDRKEEYPTIEECVHAILDDDLDALQVKRQAVKTKYPK